MAMDALARQFGVTIILVHHTTKEGANPVKGSKMSADKRLPSLKATTLTGTKCITDIPTLVLNNAYDSVPDSVPMPRQLHVAKSNLGAQWEAKCWYYTAVDARFTWYSECPPISRGPGKFLTGSKT